MCYFPVWTGIPRSSRGPRKRLSVVFQPMPAPKKTPERLAAIVEAVRNGAYAKHAAIAAGIGETTLWEWQQADPAFAETIAQAQAERTNAAIQSIADHGMRDWKANAWLLERTQPADFREQKATELSGTVNLAGLADLADET